MPLRRTQLGLFAARDDISRSECGRDSTRERGVAVSLDIHRHHLIADNDSVIRLVATDLDGTFWDADLVPPKAHLSAANELIEAGVTVLAATSRRPRVVRRQLDEVGLRSRRY
jgi:haloacid dehalogenase-like hydrolase